MGFKKRRCSRRSCLCCVACAAIVLVAGGPAIRCLFALFRHVRQVRFGRRVSLSGHLWEDQLCHWPSSLGHAGNLTSSKHVGPPNLTASFAWVAKPHPKGASGGQGGSTNIDSDGNIYLSSYDRIQKYSPDGRELWTWRPTPHTWYAHEGVVVNSGALWRGAYFNSASPGIAFALSMATGAELWSTQFIDQPRTFKSSGFVSVHEGVVVLASDWYVHGFDATDGEELWTYRPAAPPWTFLANFPGDGTFLFQDWEGRAYRCNLVDGSPVWRGGGYAVTWTGSPAVLGPNNMFYAPFSSAGGGPGVHYSFHREGGAVQAFTLEDGQLLWERQLPASPHSAPAVGRLADGRLAVVQPIGRRKKGSHLEVHTLDAETGKPIWVFRGPQHAGRRLDVGLWSAPTIDAEGTVYVGCFEGTLFALRDLDGDGQVEGDSEVQSFETGNEFIGTESFSIAPGLAAMASSDWLWVFRW